ncbi:MAG: GH12 family glycosyl hydrolase domain-containing protein [Bacillota bacterium]
MKKKFSILLCLTMVAVLLMSQVVFADVVLSGKYDMVRVNGGRYIVNNNVWGASTAQSISVNESTGAFKVTRSDHNVPSNGAPASYPSIFAGSHWGNTTSNSGMPIMVNNIGSANSSWSISPISSGAWDAAYDIWFNKSSSTSGQPDGAEMMIWLNHRGVQPAGSKVGTANIAGATWDVWYANMGWNYIAYVRTSPTNSFNADLKAFFNDAQSRGYVQGTWYLTAVEAGFELWQGGAGLSSNSFSVSVNGGGTSNPSPAVSPTRTPAPTATPTPVRSSTPVSSPTATPPSGGSGSCSVSYVVQNNWGSGATVSVTIKNNSSTPINGWTLNWTYSGNQKITNIWNGSYSQSGTSVTVKDMGYNGYIPANGSVNFGFNISYSGSNSNPTSFTLNGKVCQ